ncbi:MAG: hypothetical protein LIO92_01540 [Clostridiales bacterium]|nr:hypothetical protein [Clostridiales bacterium]
MIIKKGRRIMKEIVSFLDLRNHYNEISKQCRDEKVPGVVTVNDHENTARLQDHYQMNAKLELFRMLIEA